LAIDGSVDENWKGGGAVVMIGFGSNGEVVEDERGEGVEADCNTSSNSG
jgi:hypothetical protein